MKAYAIKDPKGKIRLDMFELTETACKDMFMDYLRISISWSICEEKGYRCVPVTITDIKSEE